MEGVLFNVVYFDEVTGLHSSELVDVDIVELPALAAEWKSILLGSHSEGLRLYDLAAVPLSNYSPIALLGSNHFISLNGRSVSHISKLNNINCPDYEAFSKQINQGI